LDSPNFGTPALQGARTGGQIAGANFDFPLSLPPSCVEPFAKDKSFEKGGSMSKQKISANELAADIKSGMDDSALMQKYRLSVQGLQRGLHKLLRAGLLEQSDLDDRWRSFATTVDIVLQCPACGKPQTRRTHECPDCGFVFKRPGEKKEH